MGIFWKNTYFMTVSPVGAELFHADRWTDGRTDRGTWRS